MASFAPRLAWQKMQFEYIETEYARLSLIWARPEVTAGKDPPVSLCKHPLQSRLALRRSMKRAVLLWLAFLGAACSSDSTAPANVLVGTWGGTGLLLTANRSSVRAQFDCDVAEFPGPLSPNSSGQFVLPGTRSPLNASVQIGAQGIASSDTITIEVIRWYPGGNNSQQFTVVRGKPAIMTAFCLDGSTVAP